MVADQVQTDILKTVCARFANLRQATPRHGLVVKFGLDPVNDAVRRKLVRADHSTPEVQYLPNCAGFELCGDATLTSTAKGGFAVAYHVLKNMHDGATTASVTHSFNDFLLHARKMYDTVDEDSLRVGIILVQEAHFFSTYTGSQGSPEMTSFQISENILRHSSPETLWAEAVGSCLHPNSPAGHKPEPRDSRALTRREIEKLVQKYIGVNGGYLGDFSYRTHREFYVALDLDFDPDKIEGTTRERFMAILGSAAPDVQAQILQGILERYPIDSTPIRTQKLHDEIAGWISRLSTGAVVTVAPLRVTSAVVQRALLDAERLMASSGTTSGVDRVHTALHGYLLQACADASIAVGIEPNLTQIFKILRGQHPAFKDVGTRSEDVVKLFGAMATVVDVLNPLRNKASVAHPNEQLLAEPEALLVINSVRTLLNYLDLKLQVKK